MLKTANYCGFFCVRNAFFFAVLHGLNGCGTGGTGPPLGGARYRIVPHHPFFLKILFGNKKINSKFVKPFSIKHFFTNFF